MPSRVIGRLVAGPSATTPNRAVGVTLVRAVTSTLIPAVARKSTLDRSMISPAGDFAAAAAIASFNWGAVSRSTVPTAGITTTRSTQDSWTSSSSWLGKTSSVATEYSAILNLMSVDPSLVRLQRSGAPLCLAAAVDSTGCKVGGHRVGRGLCGRYAHNVTHAKMRRRDVT